MGVASRRTLGHCHLGDFDHHLVAILLAASGVLDSQLAVPVSAWTEALIIFYGRTAGHQGVPNKHCVNKCVQIAYPFGHDGSLTAISLLSQPPKDLGRCYEGCLEKLR